MGKLAGILMLILTFLSLSGQEVYDFTLLYDDALTSDTNTLDHVNDTRETETHRRSSKPWRVISLSLIFLAAIAAIMQGDLIRMLGIERETQPADSQAEANAIMGAQGESEITESVEESPTISKDSELADDVGLQADREKPGDGVDSNADSTLLVVEEAQEINIPDPIVEYTITRDETEIPAIDVGEPAVESEPMERSAAVAIDWASLPSANAIVSILGADEMPHSYKLLINEDGEPLIIDFLRESNLDEAIHLQFVETSFSGSRSPLTTGQYSISGDRKLHFARGEQRARATIEMSSDPVREQDLDVTLQVQHADYSDINFATLELRLADDDQRSFESALAPDTVSFAVSQVSVREGDSAIQVDVVRYKPGNTSLDVSYVIRDVTADKGDDYIDPGENTLTFAPGQRTARILIPLVQDSSPESNEAFMLELQNVSGSAEGNIYHRIAVMIRDDDS